MTLLNIHLQTKESLFYHILHMIEHNREYLACTKN